MPESFRRVVTENVGGVAVIRSDSEIRLEKAPGFDVMGALLWTTARVPADNCKDVEGEKRDAGLALLSGSVLRVYELEPGYVSPMHRTHSIDYGIVLSGEIELELDSGQLARLRAGDIVVQRGTNHLWRNPHKTDPTRVLFVMIEADPVEVDGVVVAKTEL